MMLAKFFIFAFVSTCFILPAHTADKAEDQIWLEKDGTLLFHDRFEREELGNLKYDLGEGWYSATADRVPEIKQSDLDEGILKIDSATKKAGHAASLHHDAGFTDGGIVIRFKYPDPSSMSSFGFGFVDRKDPSTHAGHLCYARFENKSIRLRDNKTGVSNKEFRNIRQEFLDKKMDLPKKYTDMLASKDKVIPWKADNDWHEAVLVTQGDELRLSLDGSLIASHRSEGFAHPMKRWFSMGINKTIWIDDVKIYRVTLNKNVQ